MKKLLVPFCAILLFGCGQGPGPKQAGQRHPQGGTNLSAQATARLTTPWTNAALQAAVPLPEYPRPQLARAQWQNLNGRWSYFGGARAPNAERPPASAPSFPGNPEQILVPYPAESYLSGIGRQHEENLWYKRSFTVPAEWNGKRILLNFGAVDRSATVYVNGARVGNHVGGYDAFSFDITHRLRAGSNEIVVGVHDDTSGADMVGKQTNNPEEIFYTASSGIWQTVWLEPVAAPHITRLDLIPDVAGGRLRVVVRGEGLSGQSVEAVASGGGRQVGSATGSVGTELTIPIPNARLWSPGDPFLYDLKVRLRDGSTMVDEVSSYFGMRSISIGTVNGVPRPLLNGNFVFQFGPLDQGFWPDGIYTAPTDEALKSDLELTKRLGFNMVRKHIKVEPQRWFYWADKLGLLVWQDMPQAWDAGGGSSEARANVERGTREIIQEHLSSPSVITWVAFNEGWGAYEIPRVVNIIRGLDTSRLINGHSGIQYEPGDTGAGELIDLHDYPGPDAPAFQPGRPSVLGEYGGLGLRVEGHIWNTASQCCRLYPDSASLTNSYTEKIDDLRQLITTKGLSAAVYTQTTDVEDEMNGFLTYDRQIEKMDFGRVRSANLTLYSDTSEPSPLSALKLNTFLSLQVETPGFTDRFLSLENSLGVTEVIDAGSTSTLRRNATFKLVRGLADANCYSLESRTSPGSFLRHQGSRLKLAANNNTDLFRNDATFCARPGLSGQGVSFESKNFPGYFIRHIYAEVYIARNGGSKSWDSTAFFGEDASWKVAAPLAP